MAYLLVFVGGGIGAAVRYAVNRAALALLGGGFPFGTIVVNVVGSYLMGVLAGLLLTKGLDEDPVRLFLTTGVLGGFTTFSAFSLDVALMWQRGELVPLGIYMAASVFGSIGALFLGLATARVLA